MSLSQHCCPVTIAVSPSIIFLSARLKSGVLTKSRDYARNCAFELWRCVTVVYSRTFFTLAMILSAEYNVRIFLGRETVLHRVRAVKSVPFDKERTLYTHRYNWASPGVYEGPV